MSEWLTTGQMIDKLQIGQVAEGNTYWEVKLVEPGHLVELNSGENVVMNRNFLLEKWKIHPNYVSFEEAMKALKEGKRVEVRYPDGHFDIFSANSTMKFNFQELFNSKWVVVDTQ